MHIPFSFCVLFFNIMYKILFLFTSDVFYNGRCESKDFNFYFDLCVGLWQNLHINQNMQKVFKLESFRFTIKQRRQP
jgi:hypothetical protein